MKIDDVDGSDFSLEDRRGRGGGGPMGLPIPMGRGGKVGIPALLAVIIAVVVANVGGGGGGGTGLEDVLGQLGGQAPSQAPAPGATDGTRDDQEEFVAAVGTLMEDHWQGWFEESGEPFRRAGLVVFNTPTDTGGCGVGAPQAGPFYCPASDRIFVDFGFYEQLERQLGFDGDFAMAYVLAHEYGHHVQNLLGINDQVRKAQQGASETTRNELSVQLELQADCLAGVWARSAYDDRRLEDGDFDEAIDAAEAVGDDSISGGSAPQEQFTHGSSAQRKQWFTTGFDAGEPGACNTFT